MNTKPEGSGLRGAARRPRKPRAPALDTHVPADPPGEPGTVIDYGASYSVAAGEEDLKAFCLLHPHCGLGGLLGLRVTFDKASGHLIGLERRGKCDPAKLDDAALTSLVEGMRCQGEAALHLQSPSGEWRVDWRQYWARRGRK